MFLEELRLRGIGFRAGQSIVECESGDLGAYTLVTFRLSDLHAELRKRVEGIIVKRTTDLREVRTLLSMAGNTSLESQWAPILAVLP